MTDMIQLIRRNDGPVVIVDCKGDRALFNTARIEAERAGRKFKWFTNSLKRSTYIFNPFSKSIYAQLSLQEIVGLLMSALNLHHGSDYGRAWFTIASQILMKRAFEETLPPEAQKKSASGGFKHPKFGKIESFKDLNDVILFLAADGKEFQAAQHLSFLIESLAGFEQLNLSPKPHANQAACENAINMDDVIDNNEVVYFYLEGAVDSISVAEIGRLAIYCLLAACINHKERTGKKAHAYLMVDEAQAVIAQNITHVLAQARSYGLACWLANQTMSQLNPDGGADLRELVMGCTSVKQVFSARDPWLQKYVSEMSGKVRYANLSYQQNANDLLEGLFGLQYVVKNEDGIPAVEVTDYIGPRLTTQDILDINRDPNMCMLAIERNEAFSCWNGFSPVYVDWPTSEREYDERDNHSDWPKATLETITLESPWPEGSSEVIVPTKPTLAIEDYKKEATDRLDKLKRDLDDET
jgi:TraM recognition site of TraD and TraG